MQQGEEMWRLLEAYSELATDGPWWVTENDLIGGWCVRTIGDPPSSGRGITIADFVRQEDARLCVAARNLHMRIAIAEDGRLYLKPRSSRL